ncbi:DUF6053 domain-containing protein [Lysobacter enzymogenes]|uniref:DUF6053 domain-containing protein n=1 Tax=Lysobacter enzymogenes TaxID=69 RepID=UPI003D18D242
MGGPSGPMLWAQVAAGRPEGIGPEGPPTTTPSRTFGRHAPRACPLPPRPGRVFGRAGVLDCGVWTPSPTRPSPTSPPPANACAPPGRRASPTTPSAAPT